MYFATVSNPQMDASAFHPQDNLLFWVVMAACFVVIYIVLRKAKPDGDKMFLWCLAAIGGATAVALVVAWQQATTATAIISILVALGMIAWADLIPGFNKLESAPSPTPTNDNGQPSSPSGSPTPSWQTQTPPPSPQPTTKISLKLCPVCNKSTEPGKYCGECGSQLQW